jgi:hypothetical protein
MDSALVRIAWCALLAAWSLGPRLGGRTARLVTGEQDGGETRLVMASLQPVDLLNGLD